ncbi:hypothetical protein [Enterococcus sp. CWB-B31]|uniref:hypothetical protein n=1 Tax=Enterococcus sp. CWB-B31 TaxID=2885159 RepID=UPI001E4D7F6E|nr:hypothetical protein [Enterococcus sp. CWB-B31]MCB5954479.1 hypothetical protein [Enterococcus sp. CWB-B31]
MVIIVIGILVIAMLAFFSYELYKRVNLNQLNSENSKMQKKINVYRQQENSRLVVSLVIAMIFISFVLLGILYQQYLLQQDNESLKSDVAVLEKETGSAGGLVEDYKAGSLKLAEFPWGTVVESRDAAALTNYELQLSRDWKPFLGEVSVTIVRSQTTKTLTISVFSSSLANTDFQTVKKNVEKFVEELGAVPEIKMIDFNFTYRDETNTLTKQSIVYAQDDSEDQGLKRIELSK